VSPQLLQVMLIEDGRLYEYESSENGKEPVA